MAWQRCAALDDINIGTPLPIEIGKQSIALYNIDGKVYATGNICTHEHAWLSDGYLDGDCIECPLHAAVFHVPTGEVRSGPVSQPVKTYPIRIQGTDVFVDLDPA
jgi:nitrite reductase/ring-hydroxylating ferredoxin subunit